MAGDNNCLKEGFWGGLRSWLCTLNGGVLLLTLILTGLGGALFLGIDKLIEISTAVKNGDAGFAEGMILTAVVGVITTFLSLITLVVKAIVDSLTSKK